VTFGFTLGDNFCCSWAIILNECFLDVILVVSTSDQETILIKAVDKKLLTKNCAQLRNAVKEKNKGTYFSDSNISETTSDRIMNSDWDLAWDFSYVNMKEAFS